MHVFKYFEVFPDKLVDKSTVLQKETHKPTPSQVRVHPTKPNLSVDGRWWTNYLHQAPRRWIWQESHWFAFVAPWNRLSKRGNSSGSPSLLHSQSHKRQATTGATRRFGYLADFSLFDVSMLVVSRSHVSPLYPTTGRSSRIWTKDSTWASVWGLGEKQRK